METLFGTREGQESVRQEGEFGLSLARCKNSMKKAIFSWAAIFRIGGLFTKVKGWIRG